MFDFICSCVKYNSCRYFIGNYIEQEHRDKIIDKIHDSEKSYSELLSIFIEETIRINNSRVNNFSMLWWSQYLDCYTKWMPEEVVDDILILLNEENNYRTFY